MAFKVRVRNFQSLEDTGLEVSGLTVVTGSNNAGKSALLRAIRGVFENPGGNHFVRHGTDSFSVHLDFGDASVTWSKGPKVKPTYQIGSKTLHPGREVPEEVLGLGIQPIKAGSDELWPQIAPQFTGQMFLLDRSGSVIAEAVSDVERVSRLSEALRFADTDAKAATSELKLRRKDLTSAVAIAQFYDDLPAVVSAQEAAVTALAGVRKLQAALDKVRSLQAALRAAKARVVALETVRLQVVVPDTVPTTTTAAALTPVAELRGRLIRLRSVVGSIPQGVVVPSRDGVVSVLQQIKDATGLRSRLAPNSLFLSKFSDPIPVPAQTDVGRMQADVFEARRLRDRVLRLRQEASLVVPAVDPYTGGSLQRDHELLAWSRAAQAKRSRLVREAGVSLPQLPEFDTTKADKMITLQGQLSGFQSRFATVRAQIVQTESAGQAAKAELESVMAQVDALVGSLGVCPLCASTVSHT